MTDVLSAHNTATQILSNLSSNLTYLGVMEKKIPQAQPARHFKSSRTVLALTLREIDTSYGRSPGGFLWAVLEPIGAITLFTLVIALGLKLKSPSIGSNFMLFYATGFLPYTLFMQMNSRIAKSLRYSKQLMKYPRVTFIDAIIGRFVVFLTTHLIVFYILMSGIHFFFKIDVYLDFNAISLAILMAATLGLGVGCINCFLMSLFPLWENFWTMLTRPLLLLSTVIYIFEEVPWVYQDVVWYNPLIHIIGMMRRGFYPQYDAAYSTPIYVFSIALVCLSLGIIFLYRWNRELSNRD